MARRALLLAAIALAALALPSAMGTHALTLRVADDAGFDATHWSGSGTASDPYRLLSTSLVASGGYALELSGTQKHVNLSGLGITGGAAHSDAIHLYSVRNVTVWGAVLETNRVGIHVRASADVVIAGSTIKTSQVGVLIEGSRATSLRDNKVSLNDKDIQFRSSTANTLERNNLSIATGQFGLYFDDNVSYDNVIDTSNVVNAIPLRWYSRLNGTVEAPVVIANVTVDLPRITNVAQIMVHNSSNVRLERPVAKAGAASGIHLFQSHSVSIVNATAEGSLGAGILAEMSHAMRVLDTSARNNTGAGIVVRSSNESVITSSTLAGNTDAGVALTATNASQLRELALASNAGGGVRAKEAGNLTIADSAFTTNGGTQISLEALRDALVRNNSLVAQGVGTGVSIVAAVARIDNNTLRDHATGIAFTASTGNNLTGNILVLPRGGTGLSFDGPGSYDNAIAPSNLVDGTPVRWYTNVHATSSAPVVLSGVRVEVRGITNVAQVMLYRTHNVTLDAAIARNGTTAGIVVYGSNDTNLSAPVIINNTAQGILAHESLGLRVYGASVSASGSENVKVTSSLSPILENNVVQQGAGIGVLLSHTDSPTLRGNAVTGHRAAGIHLDGVGPGSAALENNLVQGNAGGGISAAGSAVGSVRANTIADNGPEGITFGGVQPGALVRSNTITNHTRGIRLAASGGTEFAANVIDARNGTGIHFDDVASYNVTLPPSNTVDGTPVRWYVGTMGNATSPVVIGDVHPELRGITNVAQIMLYRVANVTLVNATAANGTDRGIYVLDSENVSIEDSRVENNSRSGIHVSNSDDVSVLRTASTLGREDGLRADTSARVRVDNATLRDNVGRGAALEATTFVNISNTTATTNAAAGISFTNSPFPRIENSTVRGNRVGVELTGASDVHLHAIQLADNGDVGVQLTGASGRLSNLTLTGHARAFQLSGSSRLDVRDNIVTILSNQTAWHFADEGSYASTIGPTNLVNGAPMRWYANTPGLELRGVRAQQRGMTNVAQVMVYESPGALLDDVRAANGIARGIYVYSSHNVVLNASRADNNTGAGIELVYSANGVLRNSTFRDNGGSGVLVPSGGTHYIVDTTSESNAAHGVQAGEGSSLNITRATIRANALDGIVSDRGTLLHVHDGDVAHNRAAGIHVEFATTLRLGGNRIANHTRGIELRETEFGELHGNEITILPDQTALHFSDERSYNNVIPTTNRANGQPVHWHTTLAGTESQPVSLPDLRSELRGVTNVAQVMLYRSAYVNAANVTATNGTARGVYLYRSSSIVLENANVSDNAGAGVHLHSTQSSRVADALALRSAQGVKISESSNNVVLRVNASGAATGVLVSDASSRDNRVHDIEANGTARGVSDAGWNGRGVTGNNLLADAGAIKRAKLGASVSFGDATITHRLESDRIVNQTWTWGDGSPSNTSLLPEIYRPSHVYESTGTYRANLSVRTAAGATLTDSVLVDIVPPLSQPRFVAVAPGAKNLTLTWDAPEFDGASAVTSYRVYRGVEPTNTSFVAEVSSTTRSYLETGLENGRTYIIGVAAVNADGEGPRALAIGIPVAPPGPPASLSAKPGPTVVMLEWTPPVDAGGLAIQGYRVFRASTSSPLSLVATVGNVTNFTDGSLMNGYPYTYAIRAVNAQGAGDLSANATATPLGPPTPPRDARALAGDAAITLLWTTPVDHGGATVTGYRIWRGMSNESLAPLSETFPANSTRARDAGLSNGQAYYYAVSALNVVGESNRSTVLAVTPQAIDALAPVLVEREPVADAVLKESPLRLRAIYVDNDGVLPESVELALDGETLTVNATSTEASYALPALSTGLHTVHLRARDPSNNTLEEEWTFRILGAEEMVAAFEYSNLVVIPERALPGEPVTARVTVRNVGYATGNASAELLLADVLVGNISAELAEGQSTELVFEMVAPAPGTHTITAGGVSAVLAVDGEPPSEDHPVEIIPPEVEPDASASAEPDRPARPPRGTPPPRPSGSSETPIPPTIPLLALLVVVFARRRR